MSLFLAMFLSLYGMMHLYLFLKVRSAFHPGVIPAALLAILLLLLTTAPLLVHVAERGGSDLAARAIAWPGYTWMGLIFLFTAASLTVDSCRLLLFFASKYLPTLSGYTLTPSRSFLIPAVVALCCTAWGIREARSHRIERLTVATDLLPAGRDRLRVVQVSDVHIGLMLREKRLRPILELIRGAAPDLLVATGDIVDGEPGDELSLARLLGEIHPPLGKIAVTGNHEVYGGLSRSVSFLERSGFRVLRGEALEAGGITVAGVDDPAVTRGKPKDDRGEADLLRRCRGFVLLLKHRPEVAPGSRGLFDLQLSGHVHGGQIFPFGLLTRLSYPVATGYTRLDDRSALYVSRGTGTWGPPLRFLEPPEVTVIDIVRR